MAATDGVATVDRLYFPITGNFSAATSSIRAFASNIAFQISAVTKATISASGLTVNNVNPSHLSIVLEKLATAGATVEVFENSFRVQMDRRPTAVDIVTLPYPGFPTDLQPQFIALNSIAEGSAMVTENLFEARFRFVQELTRLGAEVRTDGHHALIRGRSKLSGAPVEATDIRAGAGLVLAGLVADGETTVHAVEHIDRGYVNFEKELVELGATVVRETST